MRIDRKQPIGPVVLEASEGSRLARVQSLFAVVILPSFEAYHYHSLSGRPTYRLDLGIESVRPDSYLLNSHSFLANPGWDIFVC